MHRHSGDDQSPGEQQAQRTGRPSAAQHLQDGRGAGGAARDERRPPASGGRAARRDAGRAGIGDGGAMDAAATCGQPDALMLSWERGISTTELTMELDVQTEARLHGCG